MAAIIAVGIQYPHVESKREGFQGLAGTGEGRERSQPERETGRTNVPCIPLKPNSLLPSSLLFLSML
jgi:hypothetical protein